MNVEEQKVQDLGVTECRFGFFNDAPESNPAPINEITTISKQETLIALTELERFPNDTLFKIRGPLTRFDLFIKGRSKFHGQEMLDRAKFINTIRKKFNKIDKDKF